MGLGRTMGREDLVRWAATALLLTIAESIGDGGRQVRASEGLSCKQGEGEDEEVVSHCDGRSWACVVAFEDARPWNLLVWQDG